jgi:hypothetical protein
MPAEFTAGLFAILGVLVGGLLSWWLQKHRTAADLRIALEAVKTEHIAETTARYYLNHKGYRDRSFEHLSRRLGGFEGNDLRKILVRAGAVRYLRTDGSEWWRLLSREAESINASKREDLGEDNSDL